MVIVPGTLCVTAKCRECGVFGNPRDFSGLKRGEPLSGVCRISFEFRASPFRSREERVILG